jgi:predicted nucleic acid-binding protein
VSGFLLDTNVVSELRKGGRADVGVRDWWDEHRDGELWLSVLVLGELRRGVELLRRRDTAGAEALDAWLAGLIEGFSDRVLSIDAGVAATWGSLGVPDPVPVIDGLMAATALVHELTLVTRNTTDVEATGVALMDPFSA